MRILCAYIKLSVALALTSVTLFTTSVFSQSPPTKTHNVDKGIAAAQEPRSGTLGNTENKIASAEPKPDSARNKVATDEPKPNDLKDEIDAVKAENAAVRELLLKMLEQKKILLE